MWAQLLWTNIIIGKENRIETVKWKCAPNARIQYSDLSTREKQNSTTRARSINNTIYSEQNYKHNYVHIWNINII